MILHPLLSNSSYPRGLLTTTVSLLMYQYYYISAQPAPQLYIDEWTRDVYSRAVNNHTADIQRLTDPTVVVDSLVSEGVFSQSDRSYIASAKDDDRIPRLLEKVEEKGAYHEWFAILRETGEQLAAHGRLWDILNDTCSGKSCRYLDFFRWGFYRRNKVTQTTPFSLI